MVKFAMLCDQCQTLFSGEIARSTRLRGYKSHYERNDEHYVSLSSPLNGCILCHTVRHQISRNTDQLKHVLQEDESKTIRIDRRIVFGPSHSDTFCGEMTGHVHSSQTPLYNFEFVQTNKTCEY